MSTIYHVKMRLCKYPDIEFNLDIGDVGNVLEAEIKARAYVGAQPHPRKPGENLPFLGWLISHTYSD